MKNRNIYLLFLLTLCWGPSFFFIKIALQELSPLMLAAMRIGLGALVLNITLMLRGESLPKQRRFWLDTFVAGLFSVTIPFLLINWGQQYVSSSLGALLNGLTPIFTILFSLMFLKHESLNENKIKGIVLGFLGLIVLVWPEIQEGVSATIMGIMAISLAAASYGLGWVYVRKRLVNTPSFKAPAAQLLGVSSYLVPLAILLEGKVNFELSWQTLTAVGSLGVLGTAIAFILNFKLIEKAGASYASMVSYVIPVMAVVLGVFFLGEKVTGWFFTGAVFILMGIYVGNRKPKNVSSIPDIDKCAFSKVR